MSDTKKLLKCTTHNCIKNEIRNDVSYFSETDTDYIPKYEPMSRCSTFDRNRVGAISHHYILSYLKHCTFRYNDPTEAANMRLNLSNSQHGQHLLGNHLLVIIIIITFFLFSRNFSNLFLFF